MEIKIKPTESVLPIIKLGTYGKIKFEQIITLTRTHLVAIPYFKSNEPIQLSMEMVKNLERHGVDNMVKGEIVTALKSMQQQLEKVIEELKKMTPVPVMSITSFSRFSRSGQEVGKCR